MFWEWLRNWSILSATGRTRPQSLPSLDQVQMNPELIEDLHHCVVDQVLHGLWEMIESGYWRQDHATRRRHLLHEPQVPDVQGRLTDDQHEPPSLLQADVRGAGDQVVVVAVGDRR